MQKYKLWKFAILFSKDLNSHSANFERKFWDLMNIEKSEICSENFKLFIFLWIYDKKKIKINGFYNFFFWDSNPGMGLIITWILMRFL
jgi:hypothetical protein